MVTLILKALYIYTDFQFFVCLVVADAYNVTTLHNSA